jgi:membrane protein DedA with SNARE-associated domain
VRAARPVGRVRTGRTGAHALWRFTALTALGSGVWNAVFITLGYRLGDQFVQVEQYVAPIGYAVAAALVAGVLVLALRRRRRLA